MTDSSSRQKLRHELFPAPTRRPDHHVRPNHRQRSGIAGVAQMIHRCGDETDLMVMIQVHHSKSFEVTVPRHDVNERFHVRIA